MDAASDRTVTAIFRSIFGQCLIGVGQRILTELQGIRYLGPIRSVPDRDHHRPRHAQAERWATGLAAWDLIQSHYDPQTGRGDRLVQQISEALADTGQLDLGYSLDVIGSRRLDDDSLAMIGIQRVLREYDDLDEESFRELVWQPLRDLPIEPRIVLRDLRQGVDLAAQDIGVGVSQVVPVIVAAMAGGASLIAIEQPELHIHPAVQVGMGDIFIREATNNDRRFLLETHSEHLVLRLLRRIRESAEFSVSPPELLLRPEDLAVIWVEQNAEGLILTELPVDETGEFLRPWPRGFFDERAEELF